MNHTRHGHTGQAHAGGRSPTYASWSAMHERCTRRRHPFFHRYGGRGILVCDRWADFECFLLDMGERPSGHSLDRIDNDGNYEPSNCRWATQKEQKRNRSDNRLLTAHGRTQALPAWSDETGVKPSTIRERLRRGWSDEEAVSAPVEDDAPRFEVRDERGGP